MLGPLLKVAISLVCVPALSGPTPCWKAVINDWLADGRVDAVYSAGCYRKALEELPRDLDEYSPLRRVLERAMERDRGRFRCAK